MIIAAASRTACMILPEMFIAGFNLPVRYKQSKSCKISIARSFSRCSCRAYCSGTARSSREFMVGTFGYTFILDSLSISYTLSSICHITASAPFQVTKESECNLRAFSRAFSNIAISSTAVSGNLSSQPLNTIPDVLSINRRMSGNLVRPDIILTPVSLVASWNTVSFRSIADFNQLTNCPAQSRSFLFISGADINNHFIETSATLSTELKGRTIRASVSTAASLSAQTFM